MTDISLTIDGQQVTVAQGKTVLEAAREAGIDIPTVCAHEDLPHYGACRMCIVEIEGVRGFPTSCTTPAADGMVVQTQTDELIKLRGHVLELMMSGHPNACLVCDHREMCEQYRPRPIKAGKSTRCAFCSNRDSCSLREMTLGQMKGELNLPTLYAAHNIERWDPFMDRDFNLCILCGRCWRICEKIHGQPAISIINRGRWARIGTSFYKSHVDSGCTFCGACIDICPTGALTDRYARWYGEPDEEVLSTCNLCPEGCSFRVWVRDKRLIAAHMTSFNREDRLCAIGRFAYPQIVNIPDRLRRPTVRQGEEAVPAEYEKAVAFAAEKLEEFKGGGFAVIINEAESRESRYIYDLFARTVMNGKVGRIPAAGGFEDLEPEGLRQEITGGKIKALMVAGNYLDKDALEKVEFLVAADFHQSLSTEAADVVFPVAVLSEVNGTYRNSDNEVKALTATTAPPGEARPEWTIVRDIAKAMGATKGFEEESARTITPDVERDKPPKPLKGSPRDSLELLPERFRGHYLADIVCAMEAIGLPVTPAEPPPEGAGEGFLVVDKEEVIPNFHLIKIKAPQVARFAKPGQFVIVMARETSERIPFTLIDWDKDEETITLVVEEVGRSSREAAMLKKGDRVAHVTGPLGTPFEIEKKGTVALGGGCYGIGAIYPIARAMKEAGNKVISVIEASSAHLLYMEDKLKSVSDEVLIATKDGRRGTKGGVQEVFVNLLESGTKVDMFVAVGCTFMMRMVSEATKDYGVPLYVALNPIMVDGTGMCGACRVSVGGKTKFACVDGPIFNGHEVDWDELFSRRGAYAIIEVEALPQGADLQEAREHSGPGCAGGRR
jgi:NAD(P)H-flavin reductase